MSDQSSARARPLSPTDRVRELTVELLASLHDVKDRAQDEAETARALLSASEHLDRSHWALEDLVARDHLRMLVAELEGRVQ